MEGATFLRDQPPYPAILLDDVVRADPRFRVAQPIDGFEGALHTGVVQHQHVDRADVWGGAAAAVVWRETLANFRKGHAGRRDYPKKLPRLPPAAGKLAEFCDIIARFDAVADVPWRYRHGGESG